MICSQNNIKFYNDFQLTNFNTLRIKSIAKYFFMPENEGELVSLFKKYGKENPVVIGNGSNILCSSSGIDKPVIYTGRIKSALALGSTIEIGAGYKVQALSKYALEKKLTGFEFLIGIPATLGGACYMNAGAHGQSISDNFVSAKVYDIEQNKILTLKKEDMNFSYRHSILKEKPYILLTAKFSLAKGNYDDIRAKMDENIIFRKEKQPNLAIPNAGSVFRNPENSEFSAGALIDKCNLRGFRIGDAAVWENHCNFVVNMGNATSIDYTNVVFEMYRKVKEKFNIELRPEIIYIGKMTGEEKEKWKILKK